MEHITANDEAAKDRLMKGLDGFLERDRDRALFDFSAAPPFSGAALLHAAPRGCDGRQKTASDGS